MIFLGKYSTFHRFSNGFSIYPSTIIHMPFISLRGNSPAGFLEMWLPQSSSHHPYSFFPCSRNISINHPAIASNVGKTMPKTTHLEMVNIPPIKMVMTGGIVLPTLPQFMEPPHVFFGPTSPGYSRRFKGQVGAGGSQIAGSWLCQGSDHHRFCFFYVITYYRAYRFI